VTIIKQVHDLRKSGRKVLLPVQQVNIANFNVIASSLKRMIVRQFQNRLMKEQSRSSKMKEQSRLSRSKEQSSSSKMKEQSSSSKMMERSSWSMKQMMERCWSMKSMMLGVMMKKMNSMSWGRRRKTMKRMMKMKIRKKIRLGRNSMSCRSLIQNLVLLCLQNLRSFQSKKKEKSNWSKKKVQSSSSMKKMELSKWSKN